MALKFDLESQTIELKSPIQVGNVTITKREITLLHLEDEKSGFSGTGELAPLPGLSSLSIFVATEKLKQLVTLEIRSIDLSRTVFDRYLFGHSCMPVPPEVQFAFESAILDLLINMSDKKTVEYFSLKKFVKPPTNVLIDNLTHLASYENILCIKIKIGRKNREDEINFINELCIRAPYAKLRLDGNQKFLAREIVDFAKKIDLSSIEYFEEPFDISENYSLRNSLDLRIAIDESLKKINGFPSGICALILKPSNRFGISGTLKQINSTNLPVIITHCYNDLFGIKTLERLAWYSNFHHGLFGLHHGLQGDY